MDGEPIPVDLLVDVDNAKGEIQGVAILGDPRDAEEEAPVGEVALGLAFPTADLGTNAVWVIWPKSSPSPGEMLLRRRIGAGECRRRRPAFHRGHCRAHSTS